MTPLIGLLLYAFNQMQGHMYVEITQVVKYSGENDDNQRDRNGCLSKSHDKSMYMFKSLHISSSKLDTRVSKPA